MRTEQEIKRARERLCERLATPGITPTQYAVLAGVLNALIWVDNVDDANQYTMLAILSDQPMATPQRDN